MRSHAASAGGAEAVSDAALRANQRAAAYEDSVASVTRLHPVVAKADTGYAARWFLFCDVCFGIMAYLLVLLWRSDLGEYGLLTPNAVARNWSIFVLFGITFGVFYALGLYQRELLALRALHLVTLAKALLWSSALGALVMYLLHLPIQFESRLLVVPTAALFFLFVALLRVLVLPRVLARHFRDDMRRTLVVGWPYRTEPLRERLHMLRGFNKVTLVEAVGVQPVLQRVEEYLDERDDDGRRSFGSLFVDAGSLTLQQTLSLINVGASAGVATYVASNMLRPIAARRLLIDLFEAPVVRVRRVPGRDLHAPGKRVFDAAVSLIALTLLSPLMLVIALAVKLTSSGPVFYAQERVGRRGRRFKFYKIPVHAPWRRQEVHSLGVHGRAHQRRRQQARAARRR
jgi:hypothetical protein